MINKEGKKEKFWRPRETIATAIATTLFSHIWGEKGGLAQVAFKGSSILRY
jgi:hypothetical protein